MLLCVVAVSESSPDTARHRDQLPVLPRIRTSEPPTANPFGSSQPPIVRSPSGQRAVYSGPGGGHITAVIPPHAVRKLPLLKKPTGTATAGAAAAPAAAADRNNSGSTAEPRRPLRITIGKQRDGFSAAVGASSGQDAVPGGPLSARAAAEGSAADSGPVGSSRPTGQGQQVGAQTPQQKEVPAAAAVTSAPDGTPSKEFCSGAVAAVRHLAATELARVQSREPKTAEAAAPKSGAAASQLKPGDKQSTDLLSSVFPFDQPAAAAAAGEPSLPKKPAAAKAAPKQKKAPAPLKPKKTTAAPKPAAPKASASNTKPKPKAAAAATEAAAAAARAPASDSRKRPTDRPASPPRKRPSAPAAAAVAEAPPARQEPASPVYSNTGERYNPSEVGGLHSPVHSVSAESGEQITFGSAATDPWSHQPEPDTAEQPPAAAAPEPAEEPPAPAAPAAASESAGEPLAAAVPAATAAAPQQAVSDCILEFDTEEEFIAHVVQRVEAAEAATAAAEATTATETARAERAERRAASAEHCAAELQVEVRKYRELVEVHKQLYSHSIATFYTAADNKQLRISAELRELHTQLHQANVRYGEATRYVKTRTHTDGSRSQYGAFTWYPDTPREVKERYNKYALAGEENYYELYAMQAAVEARFAY